MDYVTWPLGRSRPTVSQSDRSGDWSSCSLSRPEALAAQHRPNRHLLRATSYRSMAIADRAIDQAFSDLKKTCGGIRNDYFGLL